MDGFWGAWADFNDDGEIDAAERYIEYEIITGEDDEEEESGVSWTGRKYRIWMFRMMMEL